MKKVIKILLLITILPVIYGVFCMLQNYQIKGALEKYNESELDDKHALIRCNYNILLPEFAYVFFAMDQGHISFDQIKKVFWSTQDWDTSSTGGTTIKNTTFPELVKMVKEDCGQFQDGYDNPDPDGPAWTYSKAETIEEQAESIRLYSFRNVRYMDIFKEIYGDMSTMTDEELVALKTRITREGMDEHVETRRIIKEMEKEWETLTEDQKQKVIDTYDDWREMDDEGRVEFFNRIQSDVISGKFSLE